MPPATLILAAALVWLSVADAQAADIRNVLVDYTLTSWTQRDGLPSVIIRAIAQDKDGYLWLGTDAGPVRFDGARFTSPEAISTSPLREQSIRSLCATRDGSVWFGLGDHGGVARFRGGQVQTYGPDDGIPQGAVTLLFEDPSHIIWAHNGTGLFQFTGSRWVAASQPVPGPVTGAVIDKSGDFVVGTTSGVFRQRDGHGTFDRVYESADGVRDVAMDRAGMLWVTDSAVGIKRLPPQEPRSWHETGRGSRLLVDSQGNLWVGTLGQGLWRVQPDSPSRRPTVEKTTTLAGLSDDGVLSLFEDAAGNVWVGTLDGLNRLAPHKMTPITDLGLVNGVEAAPDGSAWIVGVDALTRLSASTVNEHRDAERLPAPVLAVNGDGRGTLWLATTAGLFTFANGRNALVEFSGTHPPRHITALATDPRGGLWISDVEQGLLRWNGSGLETVALQPSVQRSRVTATETDREGRLWLAFGDEHVAVVNLNRTVQVFGREDGLDIGAYRMLCEDHRGVVWMVGTHGLARFADGRFATLHRSTGFLSVPLVAIVEDDAGSLWIGAERPQSGIARVSPAELEKALADPTHHLRYRFFDKSDGVAGTPRATGMRAAVRTPDGNLWFVSGRGMTVIDPRTLPAGPAPPVPVIVDRALADGRFVSVASPIDLPLGANMVEIDYGVIDVSSQLQTRFRYRLEGFDRDWIDVGVRRQAFYTNLPPRTYHFRVSASRDDGSWTDASTVWTFAIQPRFFQTAWFWLVCGVMLVTLVGASWWIHLRRVRNQFSMLLGERTRVAREIHDTLLQGLFGVALRCDALASAFDASHASLRAEFLQMRRDVQDYIDEARQSIHHLRSPRLASGLTDALREAGDRITAGTPVQFALTTRGRPHECSGEIEHELLRIGQEAVANAMRHASATRINVELRYDRTGVALRVSDDGCGFDPVEIDRTNGHYGLATMRERVDSIGGRLNITSEIGLGSHIEVAVPK